MIAQLVEQRTENPCVGGSIPPHPTNIKKSVKTEKKLVKNLVVSDFFCTFALEIKKPLGSVPVIGFWAGL